MDLYFLKAIAKFICNYLCRKLKNLLVEYSTFVYGSAPKCAILLMFLSIFVNFSANSACMYITEAYKYVSRNTSW